MRLVDGKVVGGQATPILMVVCGGLLGMVIWGAHCGEGSRYDEEGLLKGGGREESDYISVKSGRRRSLIQGQGRRLIAAGKRKENRQRGQNIPTAL